MPTNRTISMCPNSNQCPKRSPKNPLEEVVVTDSRFEAQT